MATGPFEAHLGHLDERVVGFTTPSFHLAEDLAELQRVLAVSADRAAVLVCGRVLEALAKSAVEGCGLRANPQVVHNLETLKLRNLLPPAPSALAHGLRRLGNDARHVLRRLTRADAEIGAAVLEVWLEWYFVSFVAGPRIAALTTDGSTPGLCRQEDLAGWIRELIGREADVKEIARRLLDDRSGKLALSPILPSLVAESLISRDENDPARELLAVARAHHPRDLRLRQLEGLRASRAKELDLALGILEKLHAEGWEDSETLGILGGIHKRMWETTGHELHRDESFKCYQRAWRRSDEEDTYHGINVAMLSLVRGDRPGAQRTAERVKQVLLGRMRTVSTLVTSLPPPDYWDRASLAEAELLLGERDAAERLYDELEREFHATRPGDLGSTRKQKHKILEFERGLATKIIPSSAPAPRRSRHEAR